MNIHYHDDKKQKYSSHEINLEEAILGSPTLYIINVSLTSYEESKQEVLEAFDEDRRILATELRRLADSIEAIDLNHIEEK